MIRAAHRPLAGSVALGALLASLAFAAVAQAEQYPPGPGGAYPDTLTIVNLRDPAAVPHPVVGDVVLGIGGIITGFAPHQAPYGIFMQMANGLPYSGIAVFTGNVDHGPGTASNLQVGDYIVVYGKVQRFSDTDTGGGDGVAIGSLDGTNQVLIPTTSNPVQGDVLIRVVSHGNPMPPFHVGTLSELQNSTGNSAGDPWLNMLVSLPGPLVTGDATNTLNSGNTFPVYDPGCVGGTCDAGLVDGDFLADVPAPPPGSTIGEVNGIFDERSSSRRILLRSPDDLILGIPPHASDAFPIYDNDLAGPDRRDSLMVKFDRPVEKISAETISNYALGSGGVIDGIHRLDAPDDDRVVMLIRNGLDDGASESITVQGVKSLLTGTPMFTPNMLEFYNGVLELEKVNVPDPAALASSPCEDRSRFSGPGASAGKRASFAGTATGALGNFVILQSSPPTRAGLWVEAPGVSVVPGHAYLFAGALHETAGETQGTNLVYGRDLGPGITAVPAIQSVAVLSDDSCDETQLFLTGQDYEGMLVTLDRVQVVELVSGGPDFYVGLPGSGTQMAAQKTAGLSAAPNGKIYVATNTGVFLFTPTLGGIVSITGVLGRVNGELAVFPLDQSDILDFGPAPIFSVPLNVSKSATESKDPDIALGHDGALFMVWSRVFHETVHSLSLDETLNWSAALEVAHQGIQPSVTVTPSNKFAVLSSTVGPLIYKESTDGGHQMEPKVTVVDPQGTHFPGITVGAGEHLHALWERDNEGIYYGRSFTGGDDFSAPFPIALDGDGSINRLPRIAADDKDEVFAFWQYHEFGEPGVDKVLYRRSLDGGSTFSPARLVRDESNPLTSVIKLAILGDAQVGPDGAIWVLGLEQGGTDARAVLVKSTNQGFTFGLAGILPSPSETGLCPKSLAIGADGSLHALVGICGQEIYYTRSIDGGATWTDPVDVTSATSSGVGEPRGAKIILDATGTPVIVWYASTGGSTEIYSARLLN